MSSVLNALALYVFLLFVFRIAGRRTMSDMTAFDFILLLIVSEATQSALHGRDNSFTNSAILVMTLVSVDIGLSYLKLSSKPVEKVLDGVPMVIVRNGKPLHHLMKKSRIDVDDILASAREHRGLANLESIAYAILETNGTITVIPAEEQKVDQSGRPT